MRIKNSLFLLLVTTLFYACGAKKNVLSNEGLAAKKIIANHEEAAADFHTLRAKIRAGYATKEQSQSISISMRMEKDKTIWLSAKLAGIIPLAKVLITPEKVSYYEKISKSYFVGDFRFLSEFLGTKLDFEKVQNLLIGQTIYELNKKDYSLEKTETGYEFRSEAGAFLTKLFLLNPKTFKTEAQQLIRKEENQSITITYPEYQEMNGFYFPKKIVIMANEAKESTKIDIAYRSLEFDVPVSFPFTIPSGYNEITIQ